MLHDLAGVEALDLAGDAHGECRDASKWVMLPVPLFPASRFLPEGLGVVFRWA